MNETVNAILFGVLGLLPFILTLLSQALIKKAVVRSIVQVISVILFFAWMVLFYFHYQGYFSIYLSEFLTVSIFFIIYAAVLTVILVPIRFLTKIPSFIFRKLLHVSCFMSVIPVILLCKTEMLATFILIMFMFLISNAIGIVEPYEWYKTLFVEKRKGEVRSSFVLFFAVAALLTYLGWGKLYSPYLPIVSILAWGPGDGAAALIGIPFGKHKWKMKWVDQNKSIEGTIANVVVTFISVVIALFLLTPLAWHLIVLFGLLVSLVCSFAELVTRRGFDTLTVPLTAFIILSFTVLL